MKKILIKEGIVNRDYVSFLKPKYVYLNYSEDIKLNTYIYKGDLIGENYSSVSGFIRGVKLSGDNRRYFIIENDYKEKRRRSSVKYLSNNNSFINIDRRVKYLVINAIDIEPYVYVRRVLVKEISYKILYMLDSVIKMYDIRRAIIVINDDYSFNLLNTYLGTYPNIKIIKVRNYYPVGNNDILLKELCIGKSNYVIGIERLMDIYKRINKGTFSDDVLITIGGNVLKKSINVRVKEGTLLRELLLYLEYEVGDYYLMRGGPLRGKMIKDDNVVITKDDYAFMIFKDNNYMEEECVLCGKCSDVCPEKLVPVFIMNCMKNKSSLKKTNLSKCIDCGLCSYICPSKINLRSYIDKAKDMVENE